MTRNVDDAVAVFADRASEISGRVTSADGARMSGATVVVFSADRSAWFARSRRIEGVVSDRSGQYTIRNLPPGEYRIVVRTDIEPGEWFDSAVLERLLPGATPFTIAGSEQKTIDLRVR